MTANTTFTHSRNTSFTTSSINPVTMRPYEDADTPLQAFPVNADYVTNEHMDVVKAHVQFKYKLGCTLEEVAYNQGKIDLYKFIGKEKANRHLDIINNKARYEYKVGDTLELVAYMQGMMDLAEFIQTKILGIPLRR